jgi:hypothetical protein
MIFDFAIAIKDEKDLKSGHKRKKQGDIIAYKPSPWKWGNVELKNYLIVTVDGLTEDMARKLCDAHYEDGKFTTDFSIDAPKPVPLAKRRFKMPIDALTTTAKVAIDAVDLADTTKEYQPLKAVELKFLTANIFYDKEVSALSKSALMAEAIK